MSAADDARKRFWQISIAGVFFQGAAAAIDSGTIVAMLVYGLTVSVFGVGAAAAISRVGWLAPQLVVSYIAQKRALRMPFYCVGAFGRAPCLAALAALLWFGAALPHSWLITLFFVLWTMFAFIGGIVADPYNDIVARAVPSQRRSRLRAIRFFGGGLLALGVAVAAQAALGTLPFHQGHAALLLLASALFFVSAGSRAQVDIVEVTNWRRMLIRYWRATALRVAPDVSEMIVSLRPQQIEHMKQRMAAANDDYKHEFLPDDPVKRQARRIKRIEDRLEYYFGPLADVQRDIVRRMAAAMPRNEQVWFEERFARQKEVVDLAERLGRFGPTPATAQREEAA